MNLIIYCLIFHTVNVYKCVESVKFPPVTLYPVMIYKKTAKNNMLGTILAAFYQNMHNMALPAGRKGISLAVNNARRIL